jgi:hypothetical protein
MGGGVLACAAMLVATVPAAAQSNVCEEGQKLLQERQGIVQRFSKLGKPTVDNINTFCQTARGLVNNGTKLVSFMNTNGTWCRVPEQFVESIKSDHGRAQKAQANLCGQAAKVAQMKRQAAQAQKSNQSGLLGGGAVDPTTAPLPVPRGAL